jgi:hypothetical protein
MDEQFWLLLVDKTIHIMQESFEDGWGNSSIERDVVLRGYWFERHQVGSHTYVFRNDKPLAYIFSHLIIISKFIMPPIIHFMKGNYATYELRYDVLSCIIDAIEASNL